MSASAAGISRYGPNARPLLVFHRNACTQVSQPLLVITQSHLPWVRVDGTYGEGWHPRRLTWLGQDTDSAAWAGSPRGDGLLGVH